MLTPFVLFFGLTVATAVIAYWSDNLGKKLGKKRVSLLGLRPRTTATVLTVASSWGIMLFTLAVMLAVAKPLRDALFRFDQVRAQREGLSREVTELRTQSEATQREISAKEREVLLAQRSAVLAQRDERTASEREKRAREAEKLARRGAFAAQQSARSAQSRAIAARQGEQAARRAESRAKTQRENAEKQTSAARKDLRANQTRLQQIDLQLRQTDADLIDARARLQSAAANVERTQAELGRAQTELERAEKAAQAAKIGERNAKVSAQSASDAAKRAFQDAARAIQEQATAQSEVELLKSQREELRNLIAKLDREAGDLERQVAVSRNQADELLSSTALLYSSPIVIPAGLTFDARNLPPNLSTARIQDHLESLFKNVRDSAVSKLVSGRRVALWTPDIANGADPTPEIEERFFNRAAEFIAQTGEVSIRFVAPRNFLEPEKIIYARLVVVPVKPALRAGEILASASVNGRAGDAAIFTQLRELIDAGRTEATRRGANPPLSPLTPDFYEEGTNELVFDALREIGRLGRLVRVQLVVTDAISSVEPVRVRFEIARS